MECNKEEANRAKQIAEQKMQKRDFNGARKLAEKAQRLFPELENISQLLTICEVHCSAENKLNGSQMDWYKILQTEQLAGEATIKKQYRKLALLLHPDKNKFAGAEAAFKIIGEANRVLVDPTSRSLYDNKCKAIVQKPPSHQFNRSTSVSQPCGTANKFQAFPDTQFSGTHHHLQTFWTCCFFCHIRYQYPKTVLHRMMRCHHCQRSFVAYDIGGQGRTTGSSKGPFQNHDSDPNQGSKLASQNGSSTKTKKKDVNVKKEKEEVGKSKSDASVKPKESTSRNRTRKRGRYPTIVSSSSCETIKPDSEEDSILQENGSNPAGQNSELNEGLEHRKSSRQKQGFSCNEKPSDNDDHFVSSAKKSTGCDLPNNAAPSTADCNVEKSKVVDDDDGSSGPEILEYPDPDFSNFETDKAENCFRVDQMWAIYDTNDSMPRFYARVRKIFSLGFKLRITWLEPNPDNKDEVEWCDKNLPAACGKFKLGSSQLTEDLPMFSHQITWMKGPGRNCYLIYPRKDEIWALFKNWDISWHVEPEKHTPFKFEIVEVFSDFDETSGITVAYMGKVKGFVSLFRHTKLGGVTSFHIPPREIFRFSHQIPSFKMTGTEGEGVPEGSVELDPPSVPTDVDYFDAAMENGKTEVEVNGSCSKSPGNKVKQAVGSKQSSIPKNDEEGETEESRSPMPQNTYKNQSRVDRSERVLNVETHNHLDSSKEENYCDCTQHEENGTSSNADEQSNTPKKRKTNDTEKEVLTSRRSTRALNKKQA